MRKWIVGVLAAILALALVAGGAALAAYQSSVTTRLAEQIPSQLQVKPGRPWGGPPPDGKLHDYYVEALAEGLGMTREELESKLAEGETLLSIARDQGLDDEGIRDLWLQARDKALEAAVADGVINEDQADRLRERWLGPGLGAPRCGPRHRAGQRPGWDDAPPGLMPFGGRNRPWGR